MKAFSRVSVVWSVVLLCGGHAMAAKAPVQVFEVDSRGTRQAMAGVDAIATLARKSSHPKTTLYKVSLFSPQFLFPGQPAEIWQELVEVRPPGVLPQTDEKYLSPWSPKVLSAAVQRIQQVAAQYPNADGIVIDARLSSREITGFSAMARSAAIAELGLDPVDLSLQNHAEDNVNDQMVSSWRQWRVRTIARFLQTVAGAYRSSSKNKKVYVWGDAGYYIDSAFNDLRTGGDWKLWLTSGLADGALIEGHWSVGHEDLQTFVKAYRELDGDKSAHKFALYPVGSANSSPGKVRFLREWATLNNYLPELDTFVCPLNGPADETGARELLRGKAEISTVEEPKVGEVMPPVFLTSSNREVWQWHDQFPAYTTALLVVPAAARLPEKLQQAIVDAAAGLQPRGVSLRIVQKADAAPVALPVVLQDKFNDLFPYFGNQTTLILVDASGFVRTIRKLRESEIPGALSQVSPLPQTKLEGQPAPNFVMRDCNGTVRRLSDLKGKKNLLLTFFPKCFTGGCANHLSTLRDKKAAFDEREVEIWAVSIDPADVQIPFANRWKLNFPLIPDTGRNLSLLFGAAKNTSQLSDRMSVFIDKQGIVRWIDTEVSISSHGSDVLKRLAAQ